MTLWQSQDDYYTTVCSAATLQSDKKGFFQSFADNVTETAGPDWVKQFGLLKTDEEKIRKCFYDDKIFESVHGPLQNIQSLYRSKCGRIAQQKRMEGIRFAQKGKLEKALQLLSHSIVRAPRAGYEPYVDEGLTLALGFWERSSVLISLKEYDLALADVQLAIKEKLPELYRADAYYRMGDCYVGMKEKNKAIVALKLVSKLTENDFDWTNKIQLKIKEAEEIVCEETEIKHREPPQLTDGENPDIPSLSTLVNLQNSKQAGRFIVAKQPIKAGNTLAIEEPFVSALLPDKFSSHCLHCYKRLRVAIPCLECSGVAFCSTSCRDIATNTYHRYECKFLDMLLGSGMSILCHISLRIFTRTKLNYFLELKSKLGSNDTSHPYLRFYNLITHKDRRAPTDFLHRTLMALFLLRALQCAGYFGTSFDKVSLTKDEEFIGSLLLHQLQVLQFNAHEIYETLMKSPYDFKFTKLNYIAVGIYLSVAMFNHDCYPAVTRCHNKKCNGFVNGSIQKIEKTKVKCPTCRSNVKLEEMLLLIKSFVDDHGIALDAMQVGETKKAVDLFCNYSNTVHAICRPPNKDLSLCQEALRSCWALDGTVCYVPK